MTKKYRDSSSLKKFFAGIFNFKTPGSNDRKSLHIRSRDNFGQGHVSKAGQRAIKINAETGSRRVAEIIKYLLSE